MVEASADPSVVTAQLNRELRAAEEERLEREAAHAAESQALQPDGQGGALVVESVAQEPPPPPPVDPDAAFRRGRIGVVAVVVLVLFWVWLRQRR